MFRKSNKEPQLDLFGSFSNILDGRSFDQYSDAHHWHNQFRTEIVSRVDESIFKVLFSETMGAPNASVSVLIGMMCLKEGFGWSDAQLFEQCRFNLLVRSALGLFNLNDSVPTESTYYLFRQRIYEYQRHGGEDLLQRSFVSITRQQVKEYNVNGRRIRMDSKLIGSNIAYFSRYEIIHHSLIAFYKSLTRRQRALLRVQDVTQLSELASEEPGKTMYYSSQEEIKTRMESLGLLLYQLIRIFAGQESESYRLLVRVFQEQYRVVEEEKVLLRPKEEIASDSLQSPHDPDSAYRHKQDQKIKGYTVNLTETISQDSLNLITNVLVEKANVSDVEFVQPAIEQSITVTDQPVETVYVDGGYQSPDNDEFCQNIDMVYTGLQGTTSRYDLEMTPEGLLVTDTQTGQFYRGRLAKKIKTSKEDRWVIDTDKARVYFSQQAIRASHLRREVQRRSKEERNQRNNIEATIFQLGYHLGNNKSKYRGLIKHKIWAICRSLWINLVRITNFLKETYPRTIVGRINTVNISRFAWCSDLISTINWRKSPEVEMRLLS
ncbi:MAG: transposase [Ignavibacteriaceae bacterium]|jgi:hypothetical protein|nr:transposase [Ignavibacteriaceae bacterium]